jgi:hypothetical protein
MMKNITLCGSRTETDINIQIDDKKNRIGGYEVNPSGSAYEPVVALVKMVLKLGSA